MRQPPLPPALIVVGGFAGSGKTAVSRHLSVELGIPRLASDLLGRTIRDSAGLESGDAHRLAYEILFRLCDEFIGAGVTTILNLTMGWEFQWQRVDGIARRYPQTLLLPVILRCPRETCIERIRQRHEAGPEACDPPEFYLTELRMLGIWGFLARLERPDIRFIDAGAPLNQVYEGVRESIVAQMNTGARSPQAT